MRPSGLIYYEDKPETLFGVNGRAIVCFNHTDLEQERSLRLKKIAAAEKKIAKILRSPECDENSICIENEIKAAIKGVSDYFIVTNIIGTAGNTYDGNLLVPLVDEKTENSSKPPKIAGDTHYGSAENRYQMSQRGITIVAPIKEDFNPTGLLSQEKFVLDKTGVTCPAGNRTMISNFNEKEGRTITIVKHHELIMEAKEYNKTQAFKDDMKERAHIEPKNAEMKRFHGMARARYWGLPKVNVQFIITAIVANVKRLANVIGSVCYL